ncbi:MAG: nitroreductase family protein [Pseudomonadota bacterium]|nr:nitroreductase family protein [Pseudomonadota bacterium]
MNIDAKSLRQVNALKARYGKNAPSTLGPWNDHFELLLSHRSVRRFKPDPIPDSAIQNIIAAAQSSATSSNLQAWSVVMITDAAQKAEMAKIADGQKQIEECPVFLLWVADLARSKRVAESAAADLDGSNFFEAFLVAAIDAAIAAQNATVAAESIGLSTVYIGAMRNDMRRVAKLINLPPGSAVVFGLCLGHAAPGAEGEVKPRLPQSAVLFKDKYGVEQEEQLIESYDGDMTDFSKRQGMDADSWSGRVLARLGSGDGNVMRGRQHLKKAIKALGFHLR